MPRKMFATYKIGLENYAEKDDCNSGTYEYKLIRDEIKKNISVSSGDFLVNLNYKLYIKSDFFKFLARNIDVLFIVGGKFYSDREKETLNNFMMISSKVIFIATDIDALSMNKEVIDKSNYLLHQCPVNLGIKNSDHEFYSYIPEIFFNDYKNGKLPSWCKNNAVLFAGSLDGRERKVLDGKNYLQEVYNLELIVVPKGENFDYRIEYRNYIKLLHLFKYSYVCVTKEAEEIGWITSRPIEAIACNNLPIFDASYDKYNVFPKYEGAYGITTETGRLNRLAMYKEFLKQRRNKFRELVRDICDK